MAVEQEFYIPTGLSPQDWQGQFYGEAGAGGSFGSEITVQEGSGVFVNPESGEVNVTNNGPSGTPGEGPDISPPTQYGEGEYWVTDYYDTRPNRPLPGTVVTETTPDEPDVIVRDPGGNVVLPGGGGGFFTSEPAPPVTSDPGTDYPWIWGGGGGGIIGGTPPAPINITITETAPTTPPGVNRDNGSVAPIVIDASAFAGFGQAPAASAGFDLGAYIKENPEVALLAGAAVIALVIALK